MSHVKITEIPDQLIAENYNAKSSFITSDEIDYLLGNNQPIDSRDQDILELAKKFALTGNYKNAFLNLIKVIERREGK